VPAYLPTSKEIPVTADALAADSDTTPSVYHEGRRMPEHIYRGRIDRLRRDLRNQNLAGLILSDQASLYYLFGYDQLGYWVFQTVFLSAAADAPIVAICRAPDYHMIRDTGLIDEIITWYDESPTRPDQIASEVLADVPDGSRIGIELANHCLLPMWSQALTETLGARFEVVDGSALVGDMRVVKDEYEVTRFREAASQLSSAFAAASSSVGESVRECDVHLAIVSDLYSQGGDPPAIHPPIASGPRTLTQTHGLATTRRLRSGDPVTVEIGAASARYHAVGAMSYSIGRPSRELLRMRDAIVSALEPGFARMRPGAPIRDLTALTQESLTAAGFSRAGRHVGYGTGIGFSPTWVENLRLKSTESRHFVPGMTFFYFIGLVAPDESACLYLGEPVLITDTGHERVAPLDYSDWIR
jgi:Xaa-Pro aminopeptidase